MGWAIKNKEIRNAYLLVIIILFVSLSKNDGQAYLDSLGKNTLIQEDNFLRSCSELAKHKEWVEISNKFNSEFKAEPRSAKQCRERYINYVSNISMGVYFVEWSES